MSVGVLFCNSSTTVSQLKFFTASWVSNKIESCFSERITRISAFILRTTSCTILVEVEADFTIEDARDA